jgi:hypothetical protein
LIQKVLLGLHQVSFIYIYALSYVCIHQALYSIQLDIQFN